MIREAQERDIPRIVELGTRSLKDGPYAGLSEDNPVQSEKLARHIIENIGKVLLWEEEGRVSGLLGFIVYDHYFSGEKTAQEIMWYVEPEYRAGGAGMKLFWKAHELAKEMGARNMQFTAPTEQVGAIYKRFGYLQLEVCYQKGL